MKVLAEIQSRAGNGDPAGRLRRREIEAFEHLLEQLSGARSLLVTGASAAGRRALSLGIATTAAAAGKRTALLECDLADPTLADRLGLANVPGLAEYLAGAATVDGILKPVVLAGPGSAGASEPLVCVVAGRPTPNGSQLFASDRFATALAGLVTAYELVVIDGPRLDDWPSLTLLEPQVDAAIACVGAGQAGGRLSIPVNGVVVEIEEGAGG